MYPVWWPLLSVLPGNRAAKKEGGVNLGSLIHLVVKGVLWADRQVFRKRADGLVESIGIQCG